MDVSSVCPIHKIENSTVWKLSSFRFLTNTLSNIIHDVWMAGRANRSDRSLHKAGQQLLTKPSGRAARRTGHPSLFCFFRCLPKFFICGDLLHFLDGISWRRIVIRIIGYYWLLVAISVYQCLLVSISVYQCLLVPISGYQWLLVAISCPISYPISYPICYPISYPIPYPI